MNVKCKFCEDTQEMQITTCYECGESEFSLPDGWKYVRTLNSILYPSPVCCNKDKCIKANENEQKMVDRIESNRFCGTCGHSRDKPKYTFGVD